MRRRGSEPARLLRLRVRIPPVAWMSLSFICWVWSGREVFVTGPSLFHRSPTECCVSEFDFGTSTKRKPRPTMAVEPRIKEKCNVNKTRNAFLLSGHEIYLLSNISIFLQTTKAIKHARLGGWPLRCDENKKL